MSHTRGILNKVILTIMEEQENISVRIIAVQEQIEEINNLPFLSRAARTYAINQIQIYKRILKSQLRELEAKKLIISYA